MFCKKLYLYIENQGKAGSRASFATSIHLAGCQNLLVHLCLREGAKKYIFI